MPQKDWIARKVFETTYQHGRRKHRHRCISCRRIVNAGEQVIMVLQNRSSKVCHVKCDDKHPDGVTWTEVFRAWSGEDNRASRPANAA